MVFTVNKRVAAQDSGQGGPCRLEYGDPEVQGVTTPIELQLMHPLGKALRSNGRRLLGNGESPARLIYIGADLSFFPPFSLLYTPTLRFEACI